MKLSEAKERIEQMAYIPFKEYFNFNDHKNLTKNKGRTGQLLELTIGLLLSNTTLDFEDGELKTNKCDKFGNPTETMFITQITSIIDEDLFSSKSFYNSKLYKKIKHLLYVRVCKDGLPPNWMYLKPIEVDLSQPKYANLLKQLECDYNNIRNELRNQLDQSETAMLHTASGKFLQVRTKDSKPYHPIHSRLYGRIISDKNRAFYFKKEFMEYIISLEK